MRISVHSVVRTVRMRLAPAAALALLALLAVGGGLSCTNSEAVTSSSSPVELQVELVNTGGRYEFALLTLAQIQVQPLDPQAQASLGAYTIGALPPSASQDLDLTVATALPPSDFVLGTGRYGVTRVVLGQLFLFDEDFAGDETTCQTQNIYEVPGLLELTNLGDQYSFTISGGNQSTINFQLDAQAFYAAIENSAQGAGCQVNPLTLSGLAPTFLDLSSQ